MTDRLAALGTRKAELAASVAALRTTGRDLEDKLSVAVERLQHADREIHDRLVALERGAGPSSGAPTPTHTTTCPPSESGPPVDGPPGRQPPSRLVLAIVGAAAAVLIVVTIITLVVSVSGPGSSRSGGSFVDACALVTPAEATAALGTDAGPGHSVLNACIYENGPQRLLVAAVRQNAAAQYEASAGGSAKDVSGLGDRAFYREGRLGVLHGANMLLVTITPSSPEGPSPRQVAVTKAALARL